MKAIRLTLVSHAQTQAQKVGRFHAEDDGILPRGASVPQPSGIALLTAPERRTRETAALFAATAQVDPRLADCALGRWRGIALKHLQAHEPQSLAQWLAEPEAAPHGGESIAALCQRVGAWLQSFDLPGDWWAVTHPFVIRAAMVQVLGCPLASFQRIDVPPLSRLELSFTGQWRLRLGQIDEPVREEGSDR